LYTHIKNKHNGEVKPSYIFRLLVKFKDHNRMVEGVDQQR
jgi:hypothetical protein